MTISFTGFLKLKDNKNTECCLNTNNIVGAYKKENSETIDIKSTDGSSVSLSGYKYADVCKALIEAEQKGYFTLEKQNTNKTVNTSAPHPAAAKIKEEINSKTVKQAEEHKADEGFIPPVHDKPIDGKPADDIFSYIEKKDGIEVYCPNSLNTLNCMLRQHWVEQNDSSSQNLIKTCDLAFEKLPALTEETTFYRGVYGTDLPSGILDSKVGDIITPDEGYAQVAPSRYTAEKYLPEEDHKPVLFEIICPKGAKVSHTEPKNTGNGHQVEGMMPRAQKFKVLKKEQKDIIRSYPSWEDPKKYIEEKIPTTVLTLEYVL